MGLDVGMTTIQVDHVSTLNRQCFFKGSVCRTQGHLVVKLHVAAEYPAPQPPLPNMKENLW